MPDKLTFESTLKSTDTEEFIDLHFYRRIGWRLALFFGEIGITPNQVTVASILIGIASGICFYHGTFWINLLGMCLLMWANTFDSVDGQLARMTNQKTELGRILDGASGFFWFFSIYLAIIFRLWSSDGLYICLLVIFSAISHGMQTAMADYYRNAHLFFWGGEKKSELSKSVGLKARYELINWRIHPFLKCFAKLYLIYTEGQERRTPHLQAMLRTIDEKCGGAVPEWLSQAFREKSLPLLKYTNMLSFNLRSIALFIGIFIGFPVLYLLFELFVMNGMLVYMVWKYERICRDFVEQL